ncbi:MAG: hypothetical protein AAGH41_03450 [Pseudomonadota bacterium]
MSRPILSWVAVFAAAACTAVPDAENVTARPPAAQQPAPEAPSPQPLASINIPSGRCGMTLWMASGSGIEPIFQSLDVTTATMNLDGNAAPLQLEEQSGPIQLGMRARQVFKPVSDHKTTEHVELKLEWGDRFPGGLYVRGGTLTVSGADGWGRVLPVAGIAGCKA